MSVLQAIAFAIFLLLVNAYFVSAEFSLISSRVDRIQALIAQGKTRATKVEYAAEHLSMMLAGAQLGITIASLLLGKVGEPAIAHLLEPAFELIHIPHNLLHPLSFACSLAIVTYVHILFGEMVPKNISLAGPENVAMALIPSHIIFVKLTRPLLLFMNWIARVTLSWFGIEQKDELDPSVDAAQLAQMITESRSEGLLDAEEHARLSNALRTDMRSVREVLIPLEDVRTVHATITPSGILMGPRVQELEDMLAETGFSRFPVVDTQGNYMGYIHVKDVLGRLVEHVPSSTINRPLPASTIRPLVTISADATLAQALRVLRKQSAHLAQVREPQYRGGALLGVIALEDLIEEYVGTVSDWEHEQE